MKTNSPQTTYPRIQFLEGKRGQCGICRRLTETVLRIEYGAAQSTHAHLSYCEEHGGLARAEIKGLEQCRVFYESNERAANSLRMPFLLSDLKRPPDLDE